MDTCEVSDGAPRAFWRHDRTLRNISCKRTQVEHFIGDRLNATALAAIQVEQEPVEPALATKAAETCDEIGGAYDDDGKCHNAEPGTFGHKCGRPANWIGTKASGFRSGFCSGCRRHGYEARLCVAWQRILSMTARLVSGGQRPGGQGGRPAMRRVNLVLGVDMAAMGYVLPLPDKAP